jgi:hypothetical protein
MIKSTFTCFLDEQCVHTASKLLIIGLYDRFVAIRETSCFMHHSHAILFFVLGQHTLAPIVPYKLVRCVMLVLLILRAEHKEV